MMHPIEMKTHLKFRFNMIIKIMMRKSDSTNLFNEALISEVATESENGSDELFSELFFKSNY